MPDLFPQIKPAIPTPPKTEPVSSIPFKEPEIHVMPEKFIGAPAGRAPLFVAPPPVPPVPPLTGPRPVPPVPPTGRPPTTSSGPRPRKKGKGILIAAIVIILLGVATAVVILVVPFGQPEPVNVNLNTNRNRNLNRPVNVNLNIPPINVNIPPINTNVNIPPLLRSGPDADSDGLTDSEEKLIYHSDPYKVDTDADSFNDGNEVEHYFDPMAKAPARLADSGTINAVKAITQGYEVWVPTTWIQRGVDSTEFFATAPSGEFVEVLVASKPSTQSVVEWLLSISPGTTAEEVDRFRTGNGYDALRSPDRLTTYVDAGDGRMFTLVYNVDDRSDIDYRTTYEMMIRSFTILEVE